MPGMNESKENVVNLKNADITHHIEQMMPKLVVLLSSQGVISEVSEYTDALLIQQITQRLLNKHFINDTSPLTLEELNDNYASLTAGRHLASDKLIIAPSNATELDKQALAKAAVLHISAIVDGFTMNNKRIDTSDRTLSSRHKNTVRNVHHHHYHGCRDNFWRDLMLYDLFLNSSRGTCHHHSNSVPSTSRSNKGKDSDVTWPGILLAVCMIGGAFATAGYDVMQTYQRVDEIVHGEDVLGNTAKLSVTAFAGFSGYLLGAMIGASCFANPVLGGICLAFITAAAGMAAAKWLVGKIHALDNNESASLTDPRFCLTTKEEQRLIDQGTNPEVAKELLRECAMAISNEPSNGLVFWQNPHKEIIAIARKVKAGTIEEMITMDMTHKLKDRAGNKTGEKVVLSKAFNLKQPFELPRAVLAASNDISGGFMKEDQPLLSDYQNSFYGQKPSAPLLTPKEYNWDDVPEATTVYVIG